MLHWLTHSPLLVLAGSDLVRLPLFYVKVRHDSCLIHCLNRRVVYRWMCIHQVHILAILSIVTKAEVVCCIRIEELTIDIRGDLLRLQPLWLLQTFLVHDSDLLCLAVRIAVTSAWLSEFVQFPVENRPDMLVIGGYVLWASLLSICFGNIISYVWLLDDCLLNGLDATFSWSVGAVSLDVKLGSLPSLIRHGVVLQVISLHIYQSLL